MKRAPSLDDLWSSTPRPEESFRPEMLADLSGPARRYLEHALAPGARLASAVRLRMHGEIRLGRWTPFRAEQVIRPDRGMIWKAEVRSYRVPLMRGFDRLVDGKGAMRWRLLGILPVMSASGADVTCSAVDRLAAELVWLPSALCSGSVTWTTPGPSHAHVSLGVQGRRADIDYTLADDGRLEAVRLQRWGNPDGDGFRLCAFGGLVEEEGTFSHYTVPRRLRIGWHFGSPGFESGGEFIRVQVDEAVYR